MPNSCSAMSRGSNSTGTISPMPTESFELLLIDSKACLLNTVAKYKIDYTVAVKKWFIKSKLDDHKAKSVAGLSMQMGEEIARAITDYD